MIADMKRPKLNPIPGIGQNRHNYDYSVFVLHRTCLVFFRLFIFKFCNSDFSKFKSDTAFIFYAGCLNIEWNIIHKNIGLLFNKRHYPIHDKADYIYSYVIDAVQSVYLNRCP